jgi:hypothetical protein
MRSHSLKLARACEHFKTLEDELAAYIAAEDNHGVIFEGDPDRCEYRYRAWIKDPIPEELGTLVGDILHNARSCLDNLTWDLTIPSLRTGYTAFPIFFKSEGYGELTKKGLFTHRSGAYKVRGLLARPRTLIEWYQPFQRPMLRNEHPLWALHEMSNIDKHQTMHLSLMFPTEVNVKFPTQPRVFEWETGPVTDQTVIVRVVLDEPLESPMNMPLEVTADVGFGTPGPVFGWPVRPTLWEILACITGIVSDLEGFIP